MVSINIHDIHGETYLTAKPNINIEKFTYPIDLLQKRYPAAVIFSAEYLRGEHVFKVQHSVQPYQANLFSASTGQAIPKLTAEQVDGLISSFIAEPIKDIKFLNKAPTEISSRYSHIYQVTFDRFDDLTFYMDASTGEVVTVRHLWWRIFDIFWRLHIMDYDDGENIHNILLKVIAILGFIAIGMGLGTLYFRLRKQQWLRLKVHVVHSQKIQKTRLKRWQKIHKICACIVSIQMLIWIGSGIYLSFIPLDKNTYPHLPTNLYLTNNVNTVEAQKNDLMSSRSLTNLAILSSLDGIENLKKVTWQPIKNNQETLFQWYFTLTKHSYQKTIISVTSNTGVEISLSEADLENMWPQLSSRQDYIELTHHDEGLDILRGEENSIWEVTFKTYKAIYRANTGELIRIIDNDWYWHDLMLKIHFMDYTNSGSFNSIWNIIFALAALILSITGIRFIIRKWSKTKRIN